MNKVTTSAPKWLPGFTNPVANAFNMKDCDFMGKPVFQLTASGNKIEYGEPGKLQEYDVPTGVAIGTSTQSYSQNETTIMGTKTEYDDLFQANISGEYTGVNFSGSFNSSLMLHSNLFMDANTQYSLNWKVLKTYSIERHISDIAVTQDFCSAVQELEANLTKESCTMFFENYGTHFLVKAGFGGYFVMETSIADSLIRTQGNQKITAALEAGYNGILNSGTLTASMAYESSQFLQDNKESIDISIKFLGGLKNTDENAYNSSIFSLPIPLMSDPRSKMTLSLITSLFDLVPGLANPTALVDAVNGYIRDYVGNAELADGTIGFPHPIKDDVMYAKTNDGFVMSTLMIAQNGNRGYAETYAGDLPSPTTIPGCSSVHFFTGSDTWVPYASDLVPVKAEDHFRTDLVNTCGQPNAIFNFSSIEGFNLGEMTEIDLSHPNSSGVTTYSAASSGFVLLTVQTVNNGDRGWATVEQGDNKVGSSVHFFTGGDTWVPKNSSCLPVNSGDVKITCTSTSGAPAMQAFFIPMNGALTFGNGFAVPNNVDYTTDTPGFVIGYLDAANNGDRSTLKLLSGPTIGHVDTVRAATSMHLYGSNDTWVPKNSLTGPFDQGEVFNANYQATSGNPNLTLRFIPIVA
ncbi:hypothetical protein KIH87_06120 [Paraneptunicella aestuarii]|uniref:MAC/perforin domain-containing protein n=1 Tax=Paraneptunicella aestuarii TaxID=2831148 RepID=UPI001E5D4C24|nr:MAC/perforin domain-containing protein [Paraneptunicella aestuarii]UAA39927.1 hypothetical protein KIH87_06120 [Paraneptunicella aestuarii]